jgi:Ca2+/Na+ antiporter
MMILAGRLVILGWALLIAYVGYLLVVGEIGVIQAALEANRTLDVTLHVVFTALVFIGVAITVGLFLFVGVLNEGSR